MPLVPNAQTLYKVAGNNMFLGGICRAPDCTLDEHEHPEAQLTLLFAGNTPTLVTHDEAGRTTHTSIRTDSFIFVAPGQPHRLNWKNQGEVLHLWMGGGDLQQLAEDTKCSIPPSRLGEYPDPGIYEIGRLLMEEFDTTGGLTPSMLNHATSLMLARVMRVAERFSRETGTGLLSLQRLQPAVHFIGDCPERDFTLMELAALCNASVFHFARSFTLRIGCAPFAFQRQLRVKKAQQLLVTTELSIEAIGLAVGFENATHFSRMFRGQAGYSPREYRRLHSPDR
jgi:AraC family transcriptional regulator